MDEFTQESIINISTSAIRDFMRTHNLPQWPPEDYWWFGLMHAWGFPWWRLDKGKPISISELNGALYDLDVQDTEIRKPGAHTILELDNIAFVYRERRFKDGSQVLKIAPHIKGLGFNKCGHTFINARGSALALAEYLIEIDRVIPALKTACVQAYNDGLRENRIREIKLETAKVFLHDFFKGELPPNIVEYEIADSTPGAADLIRLVIHDEGTPFWRTRLFDIPYDCREFLQSDYVQTFIDDLGLQFGALELFEDEDTGEKFPIARYRPYESETEKEGLLDE